MSKAGGRPAQRTFDIEVRKHLLRGVPPADGSMRQQGTRNIDKEQRICPAIGADAGSGKELWVGAGYNSEGWWRMCKRGLKGFGETSEVWDKAEAKPKRRV